MDLYEILEQHKIWVETLGQEGIKANFYEADLRGANLFCADLREADLRSADLSNARLCGANLNGARLCGANLRNADLRDSNLYDADLRGANLFGANLRDADLPESTFIIQGEKYFISIVNGDCVNVGNQSYSVNQWRQFNRQTIEEINGKKLLKFYPRLLDIIDFYCGKGDRPQWLKEQNCVE